MFTYFLRGNHDSCHSVAVHRLIIPRADFQCMNLYIGRLKAWVRVEFNTTASKSAIRNQTAIAEKETEALTNPHMRANAVSA